MIGIEIAPDRPAERVAELGVRSADAGFDTVFCSHHYNNRDLFVALSLLADRTADVRLGPGVANPLETHPATLASRMATLDELADGRGVFGLGPGDPSTLGNLGLGEARGLEPVLEAMTIARKLWNGERVTREGTFEVADAGLNYDAREIPIYVGGEGPGMCRMAGKHADGLLYNGSHPDDVAWARARVTEGRRERPADGDGSAASEDSRELDEFDLAAYASVSIAREGGAAREAARRPVAFIAAGAAPPVLERHDLDPERAAAIGDAIAAGAFGDADERVSEAMIDAFCVAGTPETVADRIDAILEHADSLVVGAPLGPDVEEAIGLAGAACDRSNWG